MAYLRQGILKTSAPLIVFQMKRKLNVMNDNHVAEALSLWVWFLELMLADTAMLDGTTGRMCPLTFEDTLTRSWEDELIGKESLQVW